MTKLRSLGSLTAVAALATLCGCSSLDNCPDAQDPITFDGGTSDKTSLTYESSGWDDLQPFPAKTEVRFTHDLGVTPLLVKAFLSFSKSGPNGSGGGSITEVAGNEAPIECVDSHVIVIKNDTCESSFFIRVVTTGVSSEDNGDECGQ